MIRRCDPGEAERLEAIHAATFDEGWSAASIAQLISDGAIALSAEHGFILIRTVAAEADILTLAVLPQARRQGLGRELVEAGAQAAIADGATELFLEVAADNAAALALYARCGFAEVGRRRGYYARAGSPAVDALVLRRSLVAPA